MIPTLANTALAAVAVTSERIVQTAAVAAVVIAFVVLQVYSNASPLAKVSWWRWLVLKPTCLSTVWCLTCGLLGELS